MKDSTIYILRMNGLYRLYCTNIVGLQFEFSDSLKNIDWIMKSLSLFQNVRSKTMSEWNGHMACKIAELYCMSHHDKVWRKYLNSIFKCLWIQEEKKAQQQESTGQLMLCHYPNNRNLMTGHFKFDFISLQLSHNILNQFWIK